MGFDNLDELTARRLMTHMSPYDRDTLIANGVDKSFADGDLEKGLKARGDQSPKKSASQTMMRGQTYMSAEERKKAIEEDEKNRYKGPSPLQGEIKTFTAPDGRKMVRARPVKPLTTKMKEDFPDKKSVSDLLDLVKSEQRKKITRTIIQRNNTPEVGTRFATSHHEDDEDGAIVPKNKSDMHVYDKRTKRLYGPQTYYSPGEGPPTEVDTGDSREESHKSVIGQSPTGGSPNPELLAGQLRELRERSLSKMGGSPATIKPITADKFGGTTKKRIEHVNPRTGAPALAASNAGLDIARSVEIILEKAKKQVSGKEVSVEQAKKNTEKRLASERSKFTLASPPKPLEDFSGAKGVDTTDEYKIQLSKANNFLESFKKSTPGTFGVRSIGRFIQDLTEE
jgi:hypothetical protein